MASFRLSHYLVLEKIGAGGMGVVYRAHDEQLDRDVAMKVLPARVLADERSRQRFRREALALAKLNHPNIGSVYEFGSEGDTDFLVMELVSGVSLESKLAIGPLPEREVLRLGAQLADGLEAAHRQGIVHRDLKPGNLRLTEEGRLKILDFGIAQTIAAQGAESDPTLTARLTANNEMVGTLAYMAPEQIRGQRADARTDVYSAGIVLYEMATGKRPYAATSGPQLVGAILEQAPSTPSSRNHLVSPALETIILKAIDKDPARRYQSVQEMKIDLERLATGSGPSPARPVRPRRMWTAIGVVALILVSIGIWYAARRMFAPSTSGRPAGSAVTPAHPGRKAVAVLGFKNLSGRPDQAWLSTALAEMLTTELAAGEQLRMIPGENVARMKHDLSLPEADSFGNDTLGQIRKNLGSDLVVLGSYLESGGKLRLDFRMQDTQAGETVATFSENGDADQLLDLVSRTGAHLREKLALTASPAGNENVLAALPLNPEAARLYAEGLEKLRHFELLGARDALTKAVALDPTHALAHSALSSAWSGLGYEANATQEARRAFELADRLPRESRLTVEARYREVTHDWPRAVEIYQSLWNFFPDNLEYGLRLVSALSNAGHPETALVTVAQLRKLPPPGGDDSRIDLAEAQTAELMGNFPLAEQAARGALQKARTGGMPLIMAQALSAQGWAVERMGSPDQAATLLDQARNFFEAAGDRRGAARALQTRGNVLYDRGDFAGAQAAFTQALQVFREIGAKNDESNALNSLGNVLYENGKLQEARANYEHALAIDREVGSAAGVAGALGNLANVLDSLGQLQEAKQRQEEALEAFRSVHDQRGEASTLNNLGNVLSEMGDLAGARRNFEAAMKVQDQIGYKRGRGFSLLGLADALREQDSLEEARKRSQEGMALRRAISDDSNLGMSQMQLAQIALDQGNPSEAGALANEAASLLGKAKLAQQEGMARALMALTQLQTGNLPAASDSAQRATQLARQGTDLAPKLLVAIAQARVSAANGHADDATRILADVERQAAKYGYRTVEFEAQLALGEISIGAGRRRAGCQSLQALTRRASESGYLRIARRAEQACK